VGRTSWAKSARGAPNESEISSGSAELRWNGNFIGLSPEVGMVNGAGKVEQTVNSTGGPGERNTGCEAKREGLKKSMPGRWAAAIP
jgi:hypothetical protein